jgi:hypothetical protein
MATALNSQGYDVLNTGIIEILKAGKRAMISIYTNAEGTTPATDSRGNMVDREVLSASFTASYKDESGQDTNPFVVIKFKEGEFIDYFTSVDYIEDHWYVLRSVDIPKKTF